VSDDIEPVLAVDEMIDGLDLHADDVKPPPDFSVDVAIDPKHDKGSVEITDRL